MFKVKSVVAAATGFLVSFMMVANFEAKGDIYRGGDLTTD